MKRGTAGIAVITGSGMEGQFHLGGRRVVKTRYGSSITYTSRVGGRAFYVLPRHGVEHDVPPHRINYRANIAALSQLGVKTVIATTAVGSMKPEFGVGQLGLLEQFIDFTKGRSSTFFDSRATHTDMTNPYDSELCEALVSAARKKGMRLRTGLVYVCAEGPRYESAAEIRMFRVMGGDVVGMTGVPEVVLARELGLRYSSIAIATNWAAGIQGRITHEEVVTVMKECGRKVRRLVEGAIASLEANLITGRGIRRIEG
ncbi:MAG TPA: MTAP family purine nucleoside phosphorylase [Nitrososphaerales archaeon]|nr:MTAP family purine nucleoside phosphorylase [Nitrososphaerales archaeon]